jgi:hypothetical protein
MYIYVYNIYRHIQTYIDILYIYIYIYIYIYTGTAAASLHLVSDEQDVVLLADLLGLAHVARIRDHYSCLALHV